MPTVSNVLERVLGLPTKFAKYRGKYTQEGVTDVQNTGQVKVDSAFGQWIAKYASDSRFSRYLEIGTWNGRGSTCCFYEGFKDRKESYTLQSYEIDRSRAAYANQVWSFFPSIEIIYGHVNPNDTFPSYEDVLAVHSSVNREWHDADTKNFEQSPYVPMKDPQVILLDGAEYLTYFEFMYLIKHSSATVYLLDDTVSAKCAKVVEWFAVHPEWTRVAFSDTERNGWAVYERSVM
jgi:hypothetical protein